MHFEFATADRIIFGPGVVREVAPLTAELGHRALVVAAPRLDLEPLLAQLGDRGVARTVFEVAGEPTIATAVDGVACARAAGCDVVIGIGGGSALDAGKAVAVLATNEGEVLDYLDVIGRGRLLARPSLPYLAVPTTAGTGAEVTRNAVLASPEHRVKVSLRSPLMLPRVAVVDPELTYSVPPAVTASTGLDALTQVIEPYVSIAANPLTDALCREGMARAARSLRRAHADGRDAEARADMAVVSLFGGLALANARLGAVHGLAAVIGGGFPAPHGAVCARLLPFVMEANVRALRVRAPHSPALARYADIARILTGRADAGADDGMAWVADLCAALAVPPLGAYGLTEADFAGVIAQAQRASSMKSNPVSLSDEELARVLSQAS